jgi:hypothetical protein
MHTHRDSISLEYHKKKTSKESFIERLLAESQRNQSNSDFACHYAMVFLPPFFRISAYAPSQIIGSRSVTENLKTPRK